MDANAQGLYDGFRRAQKARVANALFVVARAEDLPHELAGIADEVRVQFPWGSLLAAILTPDHQVVRGISTLIRPGGTLTMLVSVVERDGVDGVAVLDERAATELARRVAGAASGSLRVKTCRPATPADIAASHSTWAKRLGSGRSLLAASPLPGGAPATAFRHAAGPPSSEAAGSPAPPPAVARAAWLLEFQRRQFSGRASGPGRA